MEFRYSRAELIALRWTGLSGIRPEFFDAKFNSIDGLFSPDKWVEHIWEVEGVKHAQNLQRPAFVKSNFKSLKNDAKGRWKNEKFKPTANNSPSTSCASLSAGREKKLAIRKCESMDSGIEIASQISAQNFGKTNKPKLKTIVKAKRAKRPKILMTEKFHSISRPGRGTLGRPILINTNHFQIKLSGEINFYRVDFRQVTERPWRMDCSALMNKLIWANADVFKGQKTIFDGKASLYSRHILPLPSSSTVFSVDADFEVSIRFVRTFTSATIQDAVMGFSGSRKWPPWNNAAAPKKSIRATEAILRDAPSKELVAVGTTAFFPREPKPQNTRQNAIANLSGTFGTCAVAGRPVDLGAGRELRIGFHQSVRTTEAGPMLVVDVSSAVFYRKLSVVDFMNEVLELKAAWRRPSALSDEQRAKFSAEIRGLSVETFGRGMPRKLHKICAVSSQPSQMHFAGKLHFPELPFLQSGAGKRAEYLPPEICGIVPDQLCRKPPTEEQLLTILEASAYSAPECEAKVAAFLEQSLSLSAPLLHEFGITVSTKMTQVQGRVLDLPELVYQESVKALPEEGMWTMDGGKRFHSAGPRLAKWAFVSLDANTRDEVLRNFVEDLRLASSEVGLHIDNEPSAYKFAADINKIESTFVELSEAIDGLQLVFVVLAGKTPAYAEVKRVGDTLLGLVTQCIQSKYLLDPAARKSGFLPCLCMKINAKMGGVNSVLDPAARLPRLFADPAMFLGACVSHPHGGDLGTPSIAAIVGSLDGHPSRYGATVRVQPRDSHWRRKWSRCEEIFEIEPMIFERLVKYQQNNNCLPTRLIIYRMALSESQVNKVLRFEMQSIRNACSRLQAGYRPGVTLISVAKRHHTRLFAADEADRVGTSQNIPPGTIVDEGIVQTRNFDFYLCSHKATKGTARPAFYHVLHDDNNLSADELQQLCYQLCHTNACSTRAISLPAPARYALLVAYRAKCHLQGDAISTGSYSAEDLANIVKVHEKMDSQMYFV